MGEEHAQGDPQPRPVPETRKMFGHRRVEVEGALRGQGEQRDRRHDLRERGEVIPRIRPSGKGLVKQTAIAGEE